METPKQATHGTAQRQILPPSSISLLSLPETQGGSDRDWSGPWGEAADGRAHDAACLGEGGNKQQAAQAHQHQQPVHVRHWRRRVAALWTSNLAQIASSIPLLRFPSASWCLRPTYFAVVAESYLLGAKAPCALALG